MQFNEGDRLLDPSPMPLEMGWERSDKGVLHVACRTDMHKCTGEMFEWWFRFQPDTQKYIWWHPIDHVFSDWIDERKGNGDTHVGTTHVVTERFSGLPADDLVVQFRDPTEFFDEAAYNAARKSGAISGAVCARISTGHNPPRDPSGAVIGGRMMHICRDTEWGMVLRSHFFPGWDLPDMGMTPEKVKETVPDAFAPALLQHGYDEFTFLSRFLPSLFIAENRDKKPVNAPW